jgi:hypothetical protein
LQWRPRAASAKSDDASETNVAAANAIVALDVSFRVGALPSSGKSMTVRGFEPRFLRYC